MLGLAAVDLASKKKQLTVGAGAVDLAQPGIEFIQRHGAILVEIEPLAGRRLVEATERRTRRDWADFFKATLEER